MSKMECKHLKMHKPIMRGFNDGNASIRSSNIFLSISGRFWFSSCSAFFKSFMMKSSSAFSN